MPASSDRNVNQCQTRMTPQTPKKWAPALPIPISTPERRCDNAKARHQALCFEKSRRNLMGRFGVPPRAAQHLRDAPHQTIGLEGRYVTPLAEYIQRVCQCQHAHAINDEPCLRDDCYGCGRELYDQNDDYSRHPAKRIFEEGWPAGWGEFPEPRVNTNCQLLLRVDRLSEKHQKAIARELLDRHRHWPSFTYTIFVAQSRKGIHDVLHEALTPYWIKVEPPTQSEMVDFLERRLLFDGIEGVTHDSLKAVGHAVDWDPRLVDGIGRRLHVLGHQALSEKAIDDIRRYRIPPRGSALVAMDQQDADEDGLF